jgi:hypothetical protein
MRWLSYLGSMPSAQSPPILPARVKHCTSANTIDQPIDFLPIVSRISRFPNALGSKNVESNCNRLWLLKGGQDSYLGSCG